MTTPNTPIPAPQRVLLIADDLTGACDAAAAFLPGRSVRVWLGPTAGGHHQDSVQAFNTDSRDLAPEDAAKAVAACAQNLPSGALLFKKLDSAGRGPIAAELLAAHEAFHTRAILFAPSFPAHGRTVLHGILHVSHAAGRETTLKLADLFPPGIHHSIAIIGKPRSLLPAFMSGKQIMICNAQTDDDLAALVEASSALPQPTLFAGSAGFALALAASRKAGHPTPPAPPPIAQAALFIIGTPHPVTQLQLRHLEQEHPGANLLLIQSEADAASVLTRFTQADPQSLVLSGGDTALRVLRTLGARSISLRGEIAPGIPWGIIDGGLADGRTVVTKSGGFGAASTLAHILSTLSGQA
jgi:D-threonate/D-erythronate kinase